MEFRQPSRKADGGRFLFLISVFVVIYNWRKYVDANGDQAAGTIVEKRESVSIHTDVWYRRFEVIRGSTILTAVIRRGGSVRRPSKALRACITGFAGRRSIVLNEMSLAGDGPISALLRAWNAPGKIPHVCRGGQIQSEGTEVELHEKEQATIHLKPIPKEETDRIRKQLGP